jgi:hypothetical protein
MKYTKLIVHYSNNYYPATKWCKETFGQSKPPGTSFGHMRWYKKDCFYSSSRTFYFRNPEDATAFSLRWS